MQAKIETMDSMLEDLKKSFDDVDSSLNDDAITIRIPEAYKAKYELLQSRSNLQFGKLLKELIKKSIDKVSGQI